MAASRLFLKSPAIFLSFRSLLAAILFTGCGIHREYVRRGELLDTIAVRLNRIEKKQLKQEEDFGRLRADAFDAIEKIEVQIGAVDAELTDLAERVERIGRRVGAWRGEITTGSSTPNETAVVIVDTAVAGIDADRLYNTAYLDFTKGEYQTAIMGFRRFIQLFPSSEMADNAQYWLGECFYSLNQLDSAEIEFKQVKNKYPDGNKVPAAVYKLGLIYQFQGKTSAAQEKFREVVENYPSSPEAKLAQERLKPKQ